MCELEKMLKKVYNLTLEEMIKCELEVAKQITEGKSIGDIAVSIIEELEKAESRKDICKAVVKAMTAGAYRLLMSKADFYLRWLEIAVLLTDIDSASKKLAEFIRGE